MTKGVPSPGGPWGYGGEFGTVQAANVLPELWDGICSHC